MKKSYFLLLMVLSSSFAYSQKVWVGPATGGNWATSSNWNNNQVPVETDIVTFNTGVTGSITNVPNQNISGLIVAGNSNIILLAPSERTLRVINGAGTNDVSVGNGSQLTIGDNLNLTLEAGAALIAGRLNVNTSRTYTTTGVTTVATKTGIVNNAGLVSSPASNRLLFADSSTYIHSRNGGIVPTATWASASIVNINGITVNAPLGLTQTFGHFNWNGAAQSANINLNGSLRTVIGNLAITNTTINDTLQLTSGTTFILNVNGNMTIGGAGTRANVSGIKNGNGNMTVNILGDFRQLGGADFVLNDNNNPPGGIAVLNISGNFLKSGGIFDFATGDDDAGAGLKGSINLSGNFSHTGGTMETTAQDPDITNGRITFNKSGLQTFIASSPGAITYTNFAVASGSILQLNSNLRLSRDDQTNLKGTFTVANGGSLNTSTFDIASQGVGGAAIFTLSAGAKLITAKPNGVQGAINTSNLTTTLNSGADFEFRGASTGVFVTTTPNTIRNLSINNTSGNVTLAMPLRVNGGLNLVAGAVTTMSNLLTIGPSGSTSDAITGSFVNGPLAKMGTTAFTFPVGKIGAGFRNIGITAPSTNSTFIAEFFRATPPTGTLAAGLVRVSACEYWDLTRSAGTGTARVILSWEPGSPCTVNGQYVTDPTTLRVAHRIGSTWLNEGRQSSTGDNASGTIVSGNIISTFSPFALASSVASANPLPVIFADVKAYEKNNNVEIEWSNLTERDVVSYTVERSANGMDFNVIARVTPISNQNERADYRSIDLGPTTAGINYYRIKAEETTGKITYSKILSVTLGETGQALKLYPNPVKGNQVTISFVNIPNGQYNLRVVSISGQEVYKRLVNNQSRNFTQAIDLPSLIKPGVYNMIITREGYRQIKTFIVQ